MTTPTYFGTTESISVTSTSADANADVLYTCPSNHDAEVTFLTITNGAATNTINVQFYHADDAEWHYINRLHSVAGGTSHDVLVNSTLFLHAGDIIAVYKTGGTIDATLSAKQYFNPARS